MYVKELAVLSKRATDGGRTLPPPPLEISGVRPRGRLPGKLPINMEGATEKSFIRLKALGNCISL